MKLKLILLSTALFGSVALTGCASDAAESMKGAVESVDPATKAITISGMAYTAAETISLDGIASGDSVNYKVDGTTVTELDKFYTAPVMAPADTTVMGDSTTIGAMADSAAAAVQNAAAGAANAIDNAVDSAAQN